MRSHHWSRSLWIRHPTDIGTGFRRFWKANPCWERCSIAPEADAVLAAAAREHRTAELRVALLQLARSNEDGSYVRVAVDWDQPEITRAKPILDKLVERRVLVSRLESDVPVIEVAHEALFRTWQPLQGWLDSGRQADNLWRGVRLLQASELLAGRHGGRQDLADLGEDSIVPASLTR